MMRRSTALRLARGPALVVALACLPVLVLGGGCTSDASEGGVPTPSWLSSPRDGTLRPDPSRTRTDNPNTPRRGLRAGGWGSGGATVSDSGGVVGDLAARDVGRLPANSFPYNVGREPLPARSTATASDLSSQDGAYRPATVYPDRAEAVRSAGSATLYPRNGGDRINPDPVRSPTLYPKNVPGGRGYVGP